MKTFAQIVIFVIAAMALVQILDEFIPMGRGLSWSWVLYLIGGAAIFVIYTRRQKSKEPWEGKNDGAPEDSGPPSPKADVLGMEQVRHRIRRRKADLRSKK